MREYAFELRLCAHLETVTDGIIARQVGGGVADGGRRVLDIVTIEPGPGFDARRVITSQSIPPAAIRSDVGVGRAVRGTRSIDLPSEPARRVVDTALDVGFFERVQRDGKVRVRQTTRYPDWIGPITAIENKPDLGDPGSLIDQLRLDVAVGLVDRVILATSSYVTAAHLNRIPDEVGIWRVWTEDGSLDVEERRSPTDLDVEDWGIEPGDREPLARRIRPVSPAEKRRARVRLAERAYGKGWRPPFPSCTEAERGETSGSRALPYCAWKGRIVDPAKCGSACPGHDPADPLVVDRDGERTARTSWDADPPGVVRSQTSLSAFQANDQGAE